MYERSAVVLERYFEDLFGLRKSNNLAQNYKNYCELFEKFNEFQIANNNEFEALEDFQAAEQTIEDIQAQEEKLYKKNAKFEYNRDLLFSDISQKPDEIQKCMEKLENDISKTQNSFITLRENFVESIRNYNEKKSILSKCKKARREAEAVYNSVFECAKQNIENIPEEYIETAKQFSSNENQEELIDLMLENGKDEKIPFNNSVVRSAVKVACDVQKRLIEAYVEAFNKTNKLINELLEGAVSIELHEKTIRNIKAKLDFLAAEKDYLVQFLDYERIMVIHGKRMHRNLMLDAAENFNTDVAQIDNLYALLIREITNKSTKKAYKELYNKSYLVDIEENDEKFKKEKNKINLSTATVMNTNYWRIEGIKNIYTVFYKEVVEIFGKDLDEFEVPKEIDEDLEYESTPEEDTVQTVEEITEAPVEVVASEIDIPEVVDEIIEDEKPDFLDVFDEIEVTVAPKKMTKSSKNKKKKTKKYTRSLENASSIFTFNKVKNINEVKEVKEEVPDISDLFDEIETEPDIFGDKYQDIDSKIAELNEFDIEEDLTSDIDMPYEEEDGVYEEESIFNSLEDEVYEELNFEELDKSKLEKKKKQKKKGLFSNLMKLNSKDNKKAAVN